MGFFLTCGGIRGQFLMSLIKLSTGLKQNVQWVTFKVTTRQSFTVPFEAQKLPQYHWRFPVQRSHLSSVPVQRIHKSKFKSKNPDIQCRSVCCQAVSEEIWKFHCLKTPLSPILILTLVCNWSKSECTHTKPKGAEAPKHKDWPMRSIPAKQIGHTWLHKVGSFKKLAVNSITLSTWPPFSFGCHLDQCYQYGHQLNQRWHIHIMACDPFVIRLSSWPMLSMWPPTKPTMTDSYNGPWPIRHQAVILTNAVNMAAN